jgi:sulfur transfer complex TusBCD TusB component (DsrH family)
MKTLSIIESAYRATIEEQDDTILWVTAAMKGAGGELTVLLRGNAVNYVVNGQDASGLSFGEWKQTQPPRITNDLQSLIGKGIDVYAVEDDLLERGVERSDLIPNVKLVNRAGVATLMNDHPRVWYW